MKPAHILQALLVVLLWGLAFIATRLGLDTFTPPQLTALRFAIAALPALVVARPPVSWGQLLGVGLTLYTGQFLFQFFGIAAGMPVGLAALVVQTQALFTILFGRLLLGERLTRRQALGLLCAVGGLALIAGSLGGQVPLWGFALTLASAVSWGLGNVALKRLPPVDTVRLAAWLSLVPPLPALGVALAVNGRNAWRLLPGASWVGVGALLYLGVISTVGAYGLWGRLLQRYPTALVAPFALLIPFVAAGASAVVFGERFGPWRLAGMALVLLGLAILVWPPATLAPPRP